MDWSLLGSLTLLILVIVLLWIALDHRHRDR